MTTDNRVRINGKTFHAAGPIKRRRISDWPVPVSASGGQPPESRYLRNPVTIGPISNAFAGDVDFDWVRHQGQITKLFDSECWTHQGVITHARLHQTLSDTGAAGESVWAPSVQTGFVNAGDTTTPCFNPHMPINFPGSSVAGLFMARTDMVTATSDYDFDLMVLSSGTWAETEALVQATAQEDAGIVDLEVHKGGAFVLYDSGTAVVVETSTDGASWSATSDTPAGRAYSGSRLLSDGNLLLAFVQQSDNTFDIEDSSNSGGAFAARLAGSVGQLRDVGFFFDRDGTSRVVVLTTDALYWYDTANYTLNRIFTLPFEGRAIEEFGGQLLIFMDGGRVYLYSSNGATQDVSPGGVQGMPDGKDIGSDTNSQVCLTRTATGVYALWSGDDVGGTNLAPLILLWTGFGWHFIWQDTATRDEDAARFIAFFENDLWWGVAGDNNVTALYQMKDIEAPFSLLGSAVEFQEDSYIDTQRLNFGSEEISTTLWDAFFNTDDVDASETIVATFGINGAARTTSTLGTVDSDLETHTFPSASSAVGSNCRTFAMRLAFARTDGSGTDNLSPKLLTAKLTFSRIPSKRYLYTVPLIVQSDQEGLQESLGTFADLDTIEDSAVMVPFEYGGRSSVNVLAIPETEIEEFIGETLNAVQNDRASSYTLFLAEV
jgi:hypothetical protein